MFADPPANSTIPISIHYCSPIDQVARSGHLNRFLREMTRRHSRATAFAKLWSRRISCYRRIRLAPLRVGRIKFRISTSRDSCIVNPPYTIGPTPCGFRLFLRAVYPSFRSSWHRRLDLGPWVLFIGIVFALEIPYRSFR